MYLCLPQHSALFNLLTTFFCSSVLPFCSYSQHHSIVPLFSFLAHFLSSTQLHIPSSVTGIFFLSSQYCSTTFHLSLNINFVAWLCYLLVVSIHNTYFLCYAHHLLLNNSHFQVFSFQYISSTIDAHSLSSSSKRLHTLHFLGTGPFE